MLQTTRLAPWNMRIAVGFLLGLSLTALLPHIQALLEAAHISPQDDSCLHAFALVSLVLLSMILVRRPRRRLD